MAKVWVTIEKRA
jgi:hypothetical protein